MLGGMDEKEQTQKASNKTYEKPEELLLPGSRFREELKDFCSLSKLKNKKTEKHRGGGRERKPPIRGRPQGPAFIKGRDAGILYRGGSMKHSKTSIWQKKGGLGKRHTG